MRTIRATPLLTVLVSVASLTGMALSTGCQSTRPRDVHGRDRDRDRVSSSNRQDDDEPRAREVRGTVERVDPVNHRIDVSQGERSEDRGGPRGGALAIYYDYRVGPGREPLRFRPQDLRPGDRIRADVLPTAGGLVVQQLEVLSREPRAFSETPDRRGAPDSPEIRPESRPEIRDVPEARDFPEARGEERPAGPLRGTVRYVDTSARTVEIETSPGQARPHRVTVQYDDATRVESQGRPASPDDLQLGNRVEIDLRVDGGGRLLLAERIAVVSREQTENH